MTYYFQKNQWEHVVYERLNKLINDYQSDTQVAFEDRAYVVFDFDNTSIIGDVEDNLMVYMLDNLLYKMSPEEFQTILNNDLFDMDELLDKSTPEVTPNKLASDIIAAYQWLWDNYINADSMSHEEVKGTTYYQAFQAKLRYFYTHVNGKFMRQAGKPWLTYWFQGYTPEELSNLTKEMLAQATEAKAEKITYNTPAEMAGQSGIVQSSFKAGLRFPQETVDLYKAFQDNGIVTYVVSASPIDVVQTATSDYWFNVPPEQVIGMYYELDEEGRILAHMKEGHAITKKEGKTEAILTKIAPLHKDREPIALFGDSMGDYHMMTNLKDVSLNVLFNCLNQDQTRDLKEKAKELYNEVETNIVVQGRDENQLILIPDPRTIAFGQEELAY